MIISSAEFRCSSQKLSQVPKDGLRDYAFIGRSNVGKSSLINKLTARKLAKVSGTPGKTKLINHFLIIYDRVATLIIFITKRSELIIKIKNVVLGSVYKTSIRIMKIVSYQTVN